MREAGRRTAVVMEIENSFGWNRRNAPSIVFAIAWFFYSIGGKQDGTTEQHHTGRRSPAGHQSV
jgi:hypothetical protein